MATSARRTALKQPGKSNSEKPAENPKELHQREIAAVHPHGQDTFTVHFAPQQFGRLSESVTFELLLAEAAGQIAEASPPFYYLWSFLFVEGIRVSKGRLKRGTRNEQIFSALLHRQIKTQLSAQIVPLKERRLSEEVALFDGEFDEVDSLRMLYHEVPPVEEGAFRYFLLKIPESRDGLEFVNKTQLADITERILKSVLPKSSGGTRKRRRLESVHYHALVCSAARENKTEHLKTLQGIPAFRGLSLNPLPPQIEDSRDNVTKLIQACLKEWERHERPDSTS